MKVYPCGTTVKTVLGNIEAIITGFTVRFKATQYEVSYFNHEGNYTAIWLNENEFTAVSIKKQTIGFIKQQ